MRIVSLLPSATEILCALGLDREIVGVSHECDFPPQAKAKPVVIHSRLPHDASPAEIDRLVSEYVHRGESLYAVDAEVLETLAPDLIIPQDLGDVWRDILWVGEETCHGPQAEALLDKIGTRLGVLEQQLDASAERPRVAFLEWLQPFYVGGHWVPEMIHRAGGEDVFGRARTPSFRITIEHVMEAAPEILLIAPCGYSAEQASAEYRSMSFPEEWNSIPAVHNRRAYALEANSYFSRSGPRLITGIEALAKLFQPAVEVSREAERASAPIAATAARSASA